MRLIAAALACVAVLGLAGCDPAAERRYYREGIGVDLYTAERAPQVELQNQYVEFVCAQAGPNCGGDWMAFVQAGMNDIDLRCDAFLTWVDAQRRDKEPVLAQLAAVNTAVHTVMTVTGASPRALDIATTAFGLAAASYINWNSRLLLAVNQSTIQEIVYVGQGKYRERIKNFPVPNRATAIYLLRNYLRLCLPSTIEMSVNISATLVQRDVPPSAVQNPVVKNIRPVAPIKTQATFMPDTPGDALVAWLYPNGIQGERDPERSKVVTEFMRERSITVRMTLFLRDARFAAPRAELARKLGLVQ